MGVIYFNPAGPNRPYMYRATVVCLTYVSNADNALYNGCIVHPFNGSEYFPYPASQYNHTINSLNAIVAGDTNVVVVVVGLLIIVCFFDASIAHLPSSGSNIE